MKVLIKLFKKVFFPFPQRSLPPQKIIIFCDECKSEKVTAKCIKSLERKLSMTDFSYTNIMVSKTYKFSLWELRCLDCGYIYESKVKEVDWKI